MRALVAALLFLRIEGSPDGPLQVSDDSLLQFTKLQVLEADSIGDDESDGPDQTLSVLENEDASVCGAGEEIISTDCLGDSLVKKQARATALMTMGGCCTAWLVKSKTATQGALMLSTGHCGKSTSATFQFDYYTRCNSTSKNHGPKCTGKRVSVAQTKDEQAIYELDLQCAVADTIDPILLDVGRPDPKEGMYLIGHPNCRPSLLSHEEAQDSGEHCQVRGFFSRGGSNRVSYYCDTQGGNSGSPVFSARTGYAFAIHSHGGCSGGMSSANSGGLLDNPGVIAAFDNIGIPYVNRKNVDLYKYDTFTKDQCRDSPQFHLLKGKSLQECKTMCVNSLTCVGIEYNTSACRINYRSGGNAKPCTAGVDAYKRDNALTVSLLHQGVPTTLPEAAKKKKAEAETKRKARQEATNKKKAKAETKLKARQEATNKKKAKAEAAKKAKQVAREARQKKQQQKR